jgi:fluoride exporter
MVPFIGFPLGTLVVNVLGCSLIGLAGGLAESRQVLGPEARSLLMIGVLGAFTTYSTFGYETLALVRDVEVAKAFLNIGLHLALGLAAVWLGGAVARAL